MNRAWTTAMLVGVATAGIAAVTAGCADDPASTDQHECTVDEDCSDDEVCDPDELICVPAADNGDNAGPHNQNQQNDNQQPNAGPNDNDPTDNQQNQDNQNQQNDGEQPDPGDRRGDRPFDDECTFADRDDQFEPQQLWSFQVDESLPYHEYDGHGAQNAFEGHSIDQVMMTPVVVDLEGAGQYPDVVFTTFATTEEDDNWDELVTGVLRAVDGTYGEHRWSVGYQELGATDEFEDDNPALGFMPGGSVAAGDIDGDGTPEIVAPVWDYSAGAGEGPQGIVAVDGDGEIVWVSDDVEPRGIEHWWGGPSIADLNGDGEPEIVVGSVVYDNEGQLLWDGRDRQELQTDPGTGSNVAPGDPLERWVGPLSVVEDIDGSSTREVITGRAAFADDGTVLWEVDDDEVPDGSTFEDGYPGVADFDDSGTADVVVVSAGTVRIHDGFDGSLLWGPVDVPDAGRLGPPTIADMTGDGTPEIGVAGSERYVVLSVDDSFDSGFTPDFDDVVVWEEDTQDLSSNTTGSSVFDFNGDGEASVVYNDEQHLWVFDGATGDEQFQADSPSVTALDNPVIADVNNDGAANIVVPTSDFECGAMFGDCAVDGAGLIAFGDADDNWVTTRRIWNQHAYSINNVEEDGTIPQNPTPSYEEHNTFRLNKLTEIEPQAAPDLHPEDPYVDTDACEATVGVWVTNAGAIQVGLVPVSLYAEQGGQRELIDSTETTAGLPPGHSEFVELSGQLPGDGWDLVVVVDDDDGEWTRNECNDDNNRMVLEADVDC